MKYKKLRAEKIGKTNQIVIRISPSTDTAIKLEAEKDGLTKASWVRKLILEQLGAAQ